MTSPHESAQSASAPTIAHESAGCVIASLHNVCIAVWGTPATPALVAALDAVGVALEARYERTSCVHMILNHVPLPDGSARVALSRAAKRAAPNLICAVTVLQGEGFWASAMRGLLTSLLWVERATFKTHICATLQDASQWLAPLHSEVSVKFSARELEAALVALCARPSVNRVTQRAG